MTGTVGQWQFDMPSAVIGAAAFVAWCIVLTWLSGPVDRALSWFAHRAEQRERDARMANWLRYARAEQQLRARSTVSNPRRGVGG
jgi:hypothetical protein